jgi:hypothetical protein
MRKNIVAGLCALALCAGCALFQPLQSQDSLDNCSSMTWQVAVTFVSGKKQTYTQKPKTIVDFAVAAKEPGQSRLSTIVVRSEGPAATEYSLSFLEISKLRNASGGELRLILYDDGLGCMSPTMKSSLVKAYEESPYSGQDYFATLRARKAECLKWSHDVLAGR